MFGGAQGREQVERLLPQLESSGMADPQKLALVEMLRSIQRYYHRPSPDGAAAAGPAGLTIPYSVHEEAITSGSNVTYNGYAHSFAGMGIQFQLFAMANLGVEILLERQRGLWKRLRSASIS